MRDLQKKLEMSVLFITHDLGVVAEVADEVVVMYLGEVVESGTVEQIFSAPRHPYTRALLSAAPRYGGGSARLPVIPGMVPSLIDRPKGCAFATRCAYMKPGLCDLSRPDIVDGPTRVRCFLDRAGVPEIFERAADVPEPMLPEVSRPKSTKVALAVDNVSKRFVRRSGTFRRTERITRAVSDVSLELHSGETLGLVGESGCGKSTLGQSIAGLIDPSDGRVSLSYGGDMREISYLPEPERRKVWQDMRFVFQDPFASLNPRMTVFELISEPLRVRPSKVTNRKDMQDRVYGAMERTGLNPDQSDRYPHAFSGGQRQRIGIARALAPNPRIVIADEPVSSAGCFSTSANPEPLSRPAAGT